MDVIYWAHQETAGLLRSGVGGAVKLVGRAVLLERVGQPKVEALWENSVKTQSWGSKGRQRWMSWLSCMDHTSKRWFRVDVL